VVYWMLFGRITPSPFAVDNTNYQVNRVLIEKVRRVQSSYNEVVSLTVNGFADVEELCRSTRGIISSAIIEACLKAKTGDQLIDVFEISLLWTFSKDFWYVPLQRDKVPSQTLSHPFFAE